MTNEEIIENGKKLFQSAENLRKSSPDLHALMLSLWDLIDEESFLGEINDLGDEVSDGGEGGWVTEAYAYNVGILPSSKRTPSQKKAIKKSKQRGTISIITRLCNSDNIDETPPAWPWLSQACLIIAWHPQKNSEDNWKIENFDPNDESLASITHLRNGLWSWKEDNSYYAYFFILPIFSLRNEYDLKRFALSPLKILFEADDPVAAAEDAFRAVPVLIA